MKTTRNCPSSSAHALRYLAEQAESILACPSGRVQQAVGRLTIRNGTANAEILAITMPQRHVHVPTVLWRGHQRIDDQDQRRVLGEAENPS